MAEDDDRHIDGAEDGEFMGFFEKATFTLEEGTVCSYQQAFCARNTKSDFARCRVLVVAGMAQVTSRTRSSWRRTKGEQRKGA